MKFSEKDFNKNYPEEHALVICCGFFNAEMQARVIEKMKEGKEGWADPENKKACRNKLSEDANSDDFDNEKRLIDIAIWAMFLWNMIPEPKEEEKS